MKLINIFLTVLLITLLPSLGWSTPFDELVERDGLYYPKFSDVPFTGEVTGTEKGYFQKGNLKNGKREGVWVEYHDNGQLGSKGSYKNGVKEGVWVRYYDNSQLMMKGNLKKGKEEGVVVR
jgi:hypothetical protein